MVSSIPHSIIDVLRLIWNLQIMLQRGLYGAQRPYNNLFNLKHHPIFLPLTIFKVLTDPLKNRGESSLVPRIHLIQVFIKLKHALVLRIDRVIC